MKYVRSIRRLAMGCLLIALLSPPAVAGEKAGTLEIPTGTKLKQAGIVTGKKPKASQVPELDASASGSAAVLLLGGTLVALGRRRRSDAAELSRLALDERVDP